MNFLQNMSSTNKSDINKILPGSTQICFQPSVWIVNSPGKPPKRSSKASAGSAALRLDPRNKTLGLGLTRNLQMIWEDLGDVSNANMRVNVCNNCEIQATHILLETLAHHLQFDPQAVLVDQSCMPVVQHSTCGSRALCMYCTNISDLVTLYGWTWLRICESNPGDDTQEKLDAEEAKWWAQSLNSSRRRRFDFNATNVFLLYYLFGWLLVEENVFARNSR